MSDSTDMVCVGMGKNCSRTLDYSSLIQAVGKKIFYLRVVRHWNKLPSKIVVPLAQVFKMHLDNALTNMLYVWVSLEIFRRLNLIFVGPFHLNYSISFHSIFIVQTEQSKPVAQCAFIITTYVYFPV